jgi:hypothetical protein
MFTVMNTTKTKFTPPSNRTEALEQTQTCFQKHQSAILMKQQMM